MGSLDESLQELLSDLPSDRALFRALIRRFDETMLMETSRADYGHDQKAHEGALRKICDVGEVNTLTWHPGEVLELVKWSRPEDPKWKPGGHGERGHIMRAVCCCALLQVSDYGAGGENENVARLIESVLSLDGDLSALIQPFLIWCMRETDFALEEFPYFVLGLIVVMAARSTSHADRDRIRRMIYWIELQDAALRRDEYAPVDERFVWGLTHSNLSHDIWLNLVQEYLDDEDFSELQQFAQKLVAEYSRRRRSKR